MCFPVPVQPHDQILLAIIGTEDLNVGLGEIPASRKRCAMASAAAVTLPTESVVLISISCLKIS